MLMKGGKNMNTSGFIVIIVLLTIAYIFEIVMHEKDKKKLKEFKKKYGDD